jgi:Flp pilus assembly protein CpaB
VTIDVVGGAAQNVLAQALDPNHRAVAIHVDQALGLAGLLCPGDTVSATVLNQFNSQTELESNSLGGCS